MKAYGVGRKDVGCCPGHDKYSPESYSNRRSKKAQTRDTKQAHGRARAQCRKELMTEREMFEASFRRPKNFFHLSAEEQWRIDKELGILDWNGEDLTAEDNKRFKAHYEDKKLKEATHESKSSKASHRRH